MDWKKVYENKKQTADKAVEVKRYSGFRSGNGRAEGTCQGTFQKL